MRKHLTITIYGKVQGVGFRWSAIEQALELDLTGFVRNQDRDQVYIEAEGEVDRLKQFLAWCHRGPQGANVEKVDYQSSEELKEFTEFKAELPSSI
jgi:acylphosphatase